MSVAAHEVLMLNFLLEDKNPKTVSLDQILSRALRALRTHLGMDIAFISELREGRRIYRYVDAAPGNASIQIGESDPLEQSYCQRVIDLRLPELIPDTSQVPAAAELEDTSALPIGAQICVPIRLFDDSIYGTLVCISGASKPTLNERDLSMMRVFAEMAAEHIEADLQATKQRVELTDRIRSVLAGDAISLVYQPVFDTRQAYVIGFESLARITTAPVRSPDAWFADAAEVNLDVALELKVIEKALESFTILPHGVYVGFNVSMNMIINGHLDSAFERTQLDRIVLEIQEEGTESQYDEVARVLAPLRSKGLRISVHDTGAGLSSFRHILRLKPDIIKLEMNLTRGIDSDPARRALAAALLQFAQENGSEVVAEGIETAAELKALRALGVTRAQGHFLGRPVALVNAAMLCHRHGAGQSATPVTG